jgi:hypothetical protein
MFYYYGAKHRYASRYQRPTHRTVVEPFAGAAGYSVHHLMRGNIDDAILVESNPRVADLWRRLLEMSPADVLALPIPEPGEWTTDYLWMTTAASSGIASSSGYTLTERAGKVAAGMLRRIAKALPHLDGRVTIVEGDYTLAPDIAATWFIDPPYQTHDHISTHSLSRGRGYGPGHGSDDLDFAALGEWCRQRVGQTIVCEYEPADWLPFVPPRATADGLGGHQTPGNRTGCRPHP